ncbi:hypothetical protein SUGI_0788680 [Cryptomeria japonica]|nr:hypothetical protein SUGI_0788680 [Cryptomeria japonica]
MPSSGFSFVLRKHLCTKRHKENKLRVHCIGEVIYRTEGEGEKCFKGKNRSARDLTNVESKPGCSSVFVEPMQWMEAVQEGAIEGKLTCKGCNARLGYFNWAGMQCSCGTWFDSICCSPEGFISWLDPSPHMLAHDLRMIYH